MRHRRILANGIVYVVMNLGHPTSRFEKPWPVGNQYVCALRMPLVIMEESLGSFGGRLRISGLSARAKPWGSIFYARQMQNAGAVGSLYYHLPAPANTAVRISSVFGSLFLLNIYAVVSLSNEAPSWR